MKFLRLISGCFFLFLLSHSPIWAQTGSGGLTGIVGDEHTTLPEAIVRIDGTKIGSFSDADGRFIVLGIPAGKQILIVEYIGYEEYRDTIEVLAGKTIDLGKIQLKEPETQIGTVEIVEHHEAGSDLKAVNIMKNAPQSVTVVSSETMEKLPDKNAAEAVKRVAGAAVSYNKAEGAYIALRGAPVDWTAAFLNGDRLPTADEDNTTRSLDLEVIPAELLDYVVVNRSVTPDMEGDNIGGVINFISRSSVDKKTLHFHGGVGYNAQAQKPTLNLNFIYGNKTKNDKFRYLINASYYGRYYASQGYKLVYGNNFNHAINRYELKDYDGMRNTAGANIALEFRPNNRLKIVTRGLFTTMIDDKYQRKMMYMYASGENQGIWQQNLHGLLLRLMGGGQAELNFKATEKLEFNVKLASYFNRFSYGDVPFGSGDPRNGYFAMEFKQIRTDTRYADQLLITQEGKVWDPNGSEPLWGYAKLLDVDHPIAGQGDHYTAINPILNFPVSPDTMYFSKAFSELGKNWESDPILAQFDLKYALRNNFKLKFGGKFRVKQGVHEHSLHTWVIDPTVAKGKVFYMKQFNLEPLNQRGGYMSELGSDFKANFLPFLTKDAFNNSSQFLTSLGDSIKEYAMNPINQDYRFWAGSKYQYTEAQTAGYAMFEWNIKSKINLVGGVRVEHTMLNQTSDTLNSTPENLVFDPVTKNYYYKPESRTTKLNYLAILPGLNLTYAPTQKINVRASVTRTFHRPNFGETKPGYAVINYSDFEFTFGNPKIRPTYSWNFDASFEYYFGAAGVLTVGGYYKRVTDHIFVVTEGDKYDPFSGIIYKGYANAGTSFVAGVELAITRKLNFLPGFLGGFGVSGNITYSYSRMSVPGRLESQPLAGQTPLLYNVSLFYEKYRLQCRVALNYTGAFLKALNLAAVKDIGLLHKDTDYDIFQGANYTMDALISYGITPKLNIFVEGNNLLNWPFFEYRGRADRPTRIEYYRQRFQMGVKFNF